MAPTPTTAPEKLERCIICKAFTERTFVCPCDLTHGICEAHDDGRRDCAWASSHPDYVIMVPCECGGYYRPANKSHETGCKGGPMVTSPTACRDGLKTVCRLPNRHMKIAYCSHILCNEQNRAEGVSSSPWVTGEEWTKALERAERDDLTAALSQAADELGGAR